MKGFRFLAGWLCLLVLAVSCRDGNASQALYEQGMLEYEEGRFEAAIISFTRASEASERVRDDALQAKISLALAETYNASSFFEEGYSAAEEACSAGDRLDDSLLAAASREQLARSLEGLGEYARADSLYALNLAAPDLPDEAQARALAGRGYLAVRYFDDPARAVQLFEAALARCEAFERFELWAAYAYSLAATDRTADAGRIFSDLEAAGLGESWAVQTWKSRLTARQGDYRTAYQLLDKASKQQQQGVLRVFRQSTVKAQRDYYELQSRQARAHERAQRLIAVLLVSVLLLALAVAILLFRIRDKRNRAERAALLDWASAMENERDELSLSQARLRSDYARLYRSYFQQVGRINEIVQASPDKERGVYYQLSRMIKDIRLDKRGQKQFEAMINRDLDDIMNHFRQDFPNYQEDTYRFIGYVFAGFDAPVIRLLMDMGSDAVVHTKKSGIKKAILASASPWKDQYLSLL